MDIGGQAVIEGVMLRNKEHFAVAVRLPDGRIKVLKERSRRLPKYFAYPFIRGVVGLGYMLYDGFRALTWSSNQQLEEEEQPTSTETFFTLAFSLLFSLVLFLGLPFLLSYLIFPNGGIVFELIDGAFRILMLVGYIALIGMMNDVKTLFKYHGAEHKVIACYEQKMLLTPRSAQTCSRFHPRCGTSFVLLVLILSVIFFSLINGPWWVKLLGRVVLLPVIAGVGYELVKLSAKYQTNPIVRFIITPGLWLQKLTTKEPTYEQLAVALEALRAVIVHNSHDHASAPESLAQQSSQS